MRRCAFKKSKTPRCQAQAESLVIHPGLTWHRLARILQLRPNASRTPCLPESTFPVTPTASPSPLKIPRKPDTSRPGRICVFPESFENTETPLRKHIRMDRLERRQAVAVHFARAVSGRAAARCQSRDSSESRATAVDVTPKIQFGQLAVAAAGITGAEVIRAVAHVCPVSRLTAPTTLLIPPNDVEQFSNLPWASRARCSVDDCCTMAFARSEADANSAIWMRLLRGKIISWKNQPVFHEIHLFPRFPECF
jgi:hypothetical protein